VLLGHVFDKLGSEKPERERVAKLLSMRNAKKRSSSKRVLALIAHLPKFLERTQDCICGFTLGCLR
jgi:hypothetical protein